MDKCPVSHEYRFPFAPPAPPRGRSSSRSSLLAARCTITTNLNNIDHAIMPPRREALLTPVINCILLTETGERFAYFGFRAVLVLYFTLELQFDEPKAIAFFAYTTCLAYLSPIVGALLADGAWGRYTTILRFGIVYIVGLSVLTAAAALEDEWLDWKRLLTLVGLLLVCLGTGGIKPCVSAFGADQVALRKDPVEVGDGLYRDAANDERIEEEDRSEDVRAFFNYFYFCINVGALASIGLVPILRQHYGFWAAFLLPTLFMITAFFLFRLMRHEYVHHVPGSEESSLLVTFKLCAWLVRQHLSQTPVVRHCISPAPMPTIHTLLPIDEPTEESSLDRRQHSRQQLDDAAKAVHVLPIMAMFPIFWCLYDQQSSVWTLQASKMGLHGLQPEQLNVVNPLEIMIFIPLFDRVIYPALTRAGWNIAPLRRMSWGMLLTAIAFFCSGWVETAIQYNAANDLEPVDVFWQLPQITILSIGEIFLSVTGLEFAYATSPDRLKAFLMAIFLLTTAVGDFLGGVLYSTIFADMARSTVMYVCGVLMLGNLCVFLLVARWWESCEYHDIRRVASQLDGLELKDRTEADD